MADFFSIGLTFHCRMVKSEVNTFKNFDVNSESLLGNQLSQLEDELQKELDKHPEEDGESIFSYYAHEMYTFAERHPSIHRESLLISIFNFLEHQLNKLCGILNIVLGNKFKLKDISGQGITRAYTYLTKVAGFDFNKLNGEWTSIKQINELRNRIVHAGGVLVNDTSNNLVKYVSSHTLLKGSAGHSVLIQQGFIDYFLQELDSFFDKLQEEVQVFQKRNIKFVEPLKFN